MKLSFYSLLKIYSHNIRYKILLNTNSTRITANSETTTTKYSISQSACTMCRIGVHNRTRRIKMYKTIYFSVKSLLFEITYVGQKATSVVIISSSFPGSDAPLQGAPAWQYKTCDLKSQTWYQNTIKTALLRKTKHIEDKGLRTFVTNRNTNAIAAAVSLNVLITSSLVDSVRRSTSQGVEGKLIILFSGIC